MDTEQKFWLTVIALVCATVLGIAICCVVYYTQATQSAFRYGYEQINGQWIKRHEVKE